MVRCPPLRSSDLGQPPIVCLPIIRPSGTNHPSNQSTMKTYKITVPSFSLEIEAKNRKEALEQYWFDYDTAQQDPEWGKPIIKEITK